MTAGVCDFEVEQGLEEVDWERMARSIARTFHRDTAAVIHQEAFGFAMEELWKAHVKWEGDHNRTYRQAYWRTQDRMRTWLGYRGADRWYRPQFVPFGLYNGPDEEPNIDSDRRLTDLSAVDPSEHVLTIDELFAMVPVKGLNIERDTEIITAWLNGRKLLAIGDQYGMTESRVCQITMKWARRWAKSVH